MTLISICAKLIYLLDTIYAKFEGQGHRLEFTVTGGKMLLKWLAKEFTVNLTSFIDTVSQSVCQSVSHSVSLSVCRHCGIYWLRFHVSQIRTFRWNDEIIKIKLFSDASVDSKRRQCDYEHFAVAGNIVKLECGPMPNLMVALPNIGGALCSTPQSLADAHY